MTKLVNFTSEIRVRTLLCCSAAVLLTACGGGLDTNNSVETNQAPQNAASTVSHTAAPAEANAPVAAPAADVNGAPDSAPANFDIVGYTVDPTAPVAESDSTNGTAPAQEPVTTQASGAQPVRLLASVTSSARNFYVAANGSDSNPGTKAAPFKTILRASKAAVPNTNIFVAPGTYAGGFQTTVSGAANGRIYYVSTTKGGAKIVPPANSSSNTAWDNRGNHVQIIGFEIDGTNTQSGTKWLQGIYTGGSFGMIKDNHVHHIAKVVPCTSAGGSAIGVDSYYGGKQTDVISNKVHDIGPAGCTYVQGIYVSTSGSVKNNVVYRVAEAAIHLWHDATNVVITNNTVSASGYGIIVGGGDFYHSSAGADYSPVHSNIVYDNKYGISEQGKTGTHNTYRNNLVYQNGTNWSLKNGLTHTGTVSSAPLFKSYDKTSGTPDFQPSTSSPAIGRGTASYAHPTDIAGKPRNTSTGFDIGAYQQ